MAVGTRQIVLLTHLANHWPTRMGMYSVRSLVDPECDHPTVKISRRRNDKMVVENQRTCHCWTQMSSIKEVYDSLINRNFIDEEDGKFQLTARGWNILDKSRKAPVTVTLFQDDGFPENFSLRKSQLKEFQILYLKED